MLPFGESTLALGLATFAPALIGVAFVTLLKGFVGPRHLAAFALGIFAWFYVDTVLGSSDLLAGVGFTGGFYQLGLVLLFVAGLLLFFQADSALFSPEGPEAGLLVPLLAAVALGVHGFAEGSAFGATASHPSATSLFGAFGGTTAGIAYALHKALEPMMVAALYAASTRGSRPATSTARDLVVLAFVFTLPSVVGATTGYYLTYDTTYFFALGAGASIYAAFRLARQVFAGPPGGGRESLNVSLAFIAGFILIYLAALLHS